MSFIVMLHDNTHHYIYFDQGTFHNVFLVFSDKGYKGFGWMGCASLT
jgi:hypothetical protein